MSEQPPTSSSVGGDEDFAWITNSLGAVRAEQEPIVREALKENATGVHAVAARIAGDPNVRNPVAVLVHALRQGRHLKSTTKPGKPPPREPERQTPMQRAHALFTGKLRDLARTSWDERERLEFAIDYALDWCGDSSIERAFRAELGVPAWHPNDPLPMPGDPAKDTEHRRLMRQVHGPQQQAQS